MKDAKQTRYEYLHSRKCIHCDGNLKLGKLQPVFICKSCNHQFSEEEIYKY